MEFCSKEKFWNFYDRNAPWMNNHIRPRELLPYFAGTLPVPMQQYILASIERLGCSYSIFHFIDAIRNRDRSHVVFFDAIKDQKGLDELVNFITEEFMQKETAPLLNCGSSSFATNVGRDRIPVQSEMTTSSSATTHDPTTSIEQPSNSFLASQPVGNVVDRDAEGSRQCLAANGVLCEEESVVGVSHSQLTASNHGRINEESASASLDWPGVQESAEPKCTINHEQACQAELCRQPECSVRAVKVELLSEGAPQSPERLACRASSPSTASDRLESSESASSVNDANPTSFLSASPHITSATQGDCTSESPQMERLKEAISFPTDASHDGESFCALLSTELAGVEGQQQSTLSPAREMPLSSLYQVSLPLAVQCTAQRGCANMTEANAERRANVSTVDGPSVLAHVPEPLRSPTEAEAVSCANVSTVGGPSVRGAKMSDPLAEPDFSQCKCDSGYKSDSELDGSDRGKDHRSLSPAIALAVLSIAVVFCAVVYARRIAALR